MSDMKEFDIENGLLTVYRGDSEDVVIPDGVTGIDEYAFFQCENLTTIIIPDSVTRIGDSAFKGCESLEAITIPNGVTSIANSTFIGCSNLKTVTIPNSVKRIGSYAFSQCTSLTDIIIPDSVTEIGREAFNLCTKLSSLEIPDSVTFIDEGAFSGCSSLTAIDIPESVTYVGASVFLGCEFLSSVKFPNSITSIAPKSFMWCWRLEAFTIPAGVKSIDEYVFRYCKNLTTVTIPESVRSISKNTFENCPNLKTVVLPQGLASFSGSALEFIWDALNKQGHRACVATSFFTQLYDLVLKDEKLLKKIKANKKIIIDYAIENDDVETAEKLFALFKTIKLDELNGYIEKAASTINVKTFLFDYKNKNYSIKKQYKHETDKQDKELGFKKRTISDWKKLYYFYVDGDNAIITGYKGTELVVVVPEKIDNYNVVAINDYAFSPQAPGLRKEVREKRGSIESVIIPDSVKNIGDYVFKNCEKLTEVIISDGVESIGYGVFDWCRNLASITIPGSVTRMGTWQKMGTSENLTIHAPAGSYAEEYADKNRILFVAE